MDNTAWINPRTSRLLSSRNVASDDLLSSNPITDHNQSSNQYSSTQKYNNTNTVGDFISQVISKNSNNNVSNNQPVEEAENSTVLKEHYIMIDSLDRDILNESRFEFQCKFASSGITMEKRAIYQNNPTIPQTSTERQQGILGPLNYAGWKDSDGKHYPPYRAGEPYGEIIGYDLIKSEGDDRGCVVDQKFQNIVSISVDKVFFPVVMNHHPYIELSSQGKTLYDIYPYLLVDIEELPQQWYGTNQSVVKTNNIMVSYMEKIPYHVFENISTNTHVYQPPKNDLKVLSFNVRFPNQNTNKDNPVIREVDSMDISKYLSPNENRSDHVGLLSLSPKTRDGNDMLLLTLDCHISPHMFQRGHRLKIKNYNSYPSTRYHLQTDIHKFESFINSNSHCIIDYETDQTNNYGMTNRILVSPPSYLECKSGKFHLTDYYTNIKSHLTSFPETLAIGDTDNESTVWKFVVSQRLSSSDVDLGQNKCQFTISLGGNHLGDLQYQYWHYRWDTPFDSSGIVDTTRSDTVTLNANTRMSLTSQSAGQHTLYVCLTNSNYKMIYPQKSQGWILQHYYPEVISSIQNLTEITNAKIDHWLSLNKLSDYGLALDISGTTTPDDPNYYVTRDRFVVDKYNREVNRYTFIKEYNQSSPWETYTWNIRTRNNATTNQNFIVLQTTINPSLTTSTTPSTSSTIDTQHYVVYGTDTNVSNQKGYYYPLYLSRIDPDMHSHQFTEIPDITFYMPNGTPNHGLSEYPKSQGLQMYREHLKQWRYSFQSILNDTSIGNVMNKMEDGSLEILIPPNDGQPPLPLYLGRWNGISWSNISYQLENGNRNMIMSAGSKELVNNDRRLEHASVLNQQLQIHLLLKITTNELDTSVIHHTKKNLVL